AQAVGPWLAAGRLRLPVGALLLALIAWPTATSLVQGIGRYVQNVANVQDSDVRIARWLAPRLPPQAVIAVNDIGAIKFLLPNRVIDLAGIINPEIRRDLNRAIAERKPWEQLMAGEIASRQPDYLVIFPAWFPHLSQDPRFRPIYSVEVRDNITMGDAEVTVYATPWTRWRDTVPGHENRSRAFHRHPRPRPAGRQRRRPCRHAGRASRSPPRRQAGQPHPGPGRRRRAAFRRPDHRFRPGDQGHQARHRNRPSGAHRQGQGPLHRLDDRRQDVRLLRRPRHA